MNYYPVIKLVLCLAAGIITAKYIQPDFTAIFTFAIITAVLCVFFIFNRILKVPFSVITLLLFILAFLSGILIYTYDHSNREYILPKELIKQKNFTAYGTITGIELKRKKELFFYCNTDSVKLGNRVFYRKTNLICRIKDESAGKRNVIYSVINPGNFISLSGTYAKGRNTRNPGEFDYNKYLNENEISGILTTYNADDFNVIKKDRYIFRSIIFNIRKYIDGRMSALHDEQTASLLRGLVLADRSDIDFDVRNNFVNTGVVHVLAVSGLHVAYIAVIFILLFGRVNPVLRSAIILAGLTVYMFLTGATPSVVRATVMAGAVIIAYLFNRSTNIYNSLAISAFIILAAAPSELFNAGFQLSYAAVISIVALHPMFKNYIESFENLNKWIKKLLLFASVSICAQLGTLPFTMAYFSKLSLSAIFTNLLVIPLTGGQLAVSFFTLAVDTISSQLAYIIAGANELGTILLYAFVNYSGKIDYSFLVIHQFTLIDSVIFYAFLLLNILFFRWIKNLWIKGTFVAFSIAAVIFLSSLDNIDLLPDNKLSVYMIDVGQGDAFLVSFPGGKTALIDAGEATAAFDNGERIIIPLLDFLGINKIDYAFISHMDSDHYSGFASLIHEGKIARVYKPLPDSSKSIDIKFEQFVKKEQIPLKYYQKDVISIGGANIKILSSSDIPGWAKLSTNNKSSLIKVEYGKTSFLFTGDIEHIAENYYLEKYGGLLKANILKVSHHGSLTASSEKFLQTVHPDVSLVSAGIKNKFKLPAETILLRLNSIGSKVYRTDIEGGVLYQSDGKSLKYINWKKLFNYQD